VRRREQTVPQEPTIPDSVFADVEAETNQGLTRRWVTDSDFRRGLLEHPNPMEFAAEHGFTLQQETSDWIKERVHAHGVARIAGAAPTDLAPG
jgi:hypothetical protein